METEEAYNQWSEQYDTNHNKTRDLEAIALRESFTGLSFENCLEIGCGTGKNTSWLITKAKKVTAVDLSYSMLTKAIEKIGADKATFIQADITKPWNFTFPPYDLIIFSLVLEHIENLDFIFAEASRVLHKGGRIYAGELHPFKQYTGSKARFETAESLQTVTCFTHHVSDFINIAKRYALELETFDEYFDNDDRTAAPRIVKLVWKKAT
jgi:ubiquinone/menaquinone biosynthesis C-methylase UbiE